MIKTGLIGASCAMMSALIGLPQRGVTKTWSLECFVCDAAGQG